jgi:glucosyl-3-phosphoglycerate phosphatase
VTLLLLVRHGETSWNGARRLQGQLDQSLSETGRAQVAKLAPVVRAYAPDDVVSSPLARAVQSADTLGYVPRVDPRWQEAHLGEWQGLLTAALRAESEESYQQWRTGRFTPRGAEPFEAMQSRVREAAEELRGSGGDVVLVVTHGGPIRALCQALVGLDPASAVPVGPASLTTLHLEAGRARLGSYNVTGHSHAGDPAD